MAFFEEKPQKKTWKGKKKMWDAVTYIRMLTDQHYVPDFTGKGAKVAQVGGNGVF